MGILSKKKRQHSNTRQPLLIKRLGVQFQILKWLLKPSKQNDTLDGRIWIAVNTDRFGRTQHKARIENAKRDAHLELSEREAFLVRNGDHSWLNYESIKASRSLMLPINWDKTRDDGAPECTHSLEVADLILNNLSQGVLDNWTNIVRKAYGDETRTDAQLTQEAKEAIAFIAYHHDSVEDNRDKLTSKQIVDMCWKGHPAMKETLAKYIDLLTDPEGLSKEKTMDLQILTANHKDPTGLIKELRFYDKWSGLYRDFISITQKKTIPQKGRVWKVYDYIMEKKQYIACLDFPPDENGHSIPYKLYDRLGNTTIQALGKLVNSLIEKHGAAVRPNLFHIPTPYMPNKSPKPLLVSPSIKA